MRVASSWLIAAGCAASLWAHQAQGDHLLDQFDRSKPAIYRQLQSRRADQRLAALDKLRTYPLPDAARMIHGCFDDADEEVRAAAYGALEANSGEQAVCDALLELAKSGMRSPHGPQSVPLALAALLSSNLPRAQLSALQFLDNVVADSPHGPEILVAIADSLGVHGKPSNVRPLARLANTKVFAEHFGVRRAVVGALAKIPDKTAVAALVEILDEVGGEARADAARHLTLVTGEPFGTDGTQWARWWNDAKSVFEYPGSSAHAPKFTIVRESEGREYYGIPLFADRVVFVLDTSGSMQGGRIDAAKQELTKTIDRLPSHAHFGIVVYNGVVGRWQSKLVKADQRMKRAATEFIERQSAQSHTASYDALATALEYDTEAIYFLSDGAPTAGKIVAPVDILTAIGQQNRVRRISIYTIGIAPGFPGSMTDAFLKNLAEQNLGQYRRIDG